MIRFDGKMLAVDYSVPKSLTLRQRMPGLKYEPYAVREAAEKLKTNKYADLARNVTKIMNSFPWLQSHLEDLGTEASSFAEIQK
jgi:hypothetical protein